MLRFLFFSLTTNLLFKGFRLSCIIYKIPFFLSVVLTYWKNSVLEKRVEKRIYSIIANSKIISGSIHPVKCWLLAISMVRNV